MSEQTYCDFRGDLFKPFTSAKKKIVPQVSDDWYIIPKSYNTVDGIGLRSPKLDQSIYDINMRRFIRLLGEYNIKTKGARLFGEFIISSDRDLYTGEMYNEWKDKYDKKIESVLSENDLIVGNRYKTISGLTFVYLGAYYSKTIKRDRVVIESNFLNNMTQCKRKHYIIYDNKTFPSVLESKVKVVGLVEENAKNVNDCKLIMKRLYYSLFPEIISENKIGDDISFEKIDLDSVGCSNIKELSRSYKPYKPYFFKFKHYDGVFMLDADYNYNVERPRYTYPIDKSYTFKIEGGCKVPYNKQYMEVVIKDGVIIKTGNLVTARTLNEQQELREIECYYTLMG